MKDFLLDEDDDLLIDEEAGDLVTGDSNVQEQNLLLMLAKGTIKEHPTATVDAMNYLESDDAVGLLREVRLKFSADGRKVEKVGFTKDDKLIIDAPYK